MADNGVVCSMSRSGNVWDNAAMESFFSSLKTERTARKTIGRGTRPRADVFDYIERFYNAKRRHSTIGYLSPMEFETEGWISLSGCHPNRVQATTIGCLADLLLAKGQSFHDGRHQGSILLIQTRHCRKHSPRRGARHRPKDHFFENFAKIGRRLRRPLLKEVQNRPSRHSGNLLQSIRRDSVQPSLVFLNLLACDTELQRERFLTHPGFNARCLDLGGDRFAKRARCFLRFVAMALFLGAGAKYSTSSAWAVFPKHSRRRTCRAQPIRLDAGDASSSNKVPRGQRIGG